MVTFDAELFGSRLGRLYTSWRNGEGWAPPAANGGGDAAPSTSSSPPAALALAAGASSDELRYRKTTAMHLWLFTYELPDTIMVFTPTQLHVLTSSKKAALLEPLKQAARKSAAGVELVLHPRAKGDDGAAGVDALLAAASSALSATAVKPEPGSEEQQQQQPAPALGVLAKEPPVGALGELWLSRLAASGAATCDAGPGLSRVLAAKDAAELAAVRGAALLAAACVTRSVAPTLEKVVDEEREVTHARLAARFDKALADPTKLFGGDAAAAAKALPDPSAVDAAFTPCVQSGGTYDLKLGAAPDESKLQPDVIVVSLGARASSYCAAVGRTYFVDPDATQEKEYKALCAAFDAAVGALRPGAPLSAARDAAVAALEASEAPHLAKMLPKVVGGGVGLEVRESALALSSTSTTKVEPGMCFVVRLGVTGLTRDDPPEGKAAAYALLVCDTVAVPLSGSKEGGENKEDKDGAADAAASAPAEVLTASASRAWGDVAYELDGGSEDGDDESEGLDDADGGGAAGGAEGGIAERKKALRAAAADASGADRDRAKRGQDALLERINQITLEALTSKGGAGGAGGKTGRKLSNVCAYKSPQDVLAPPAARVSVDARAESLLLPIYGATLPLHILTVKNAMHSQDGDHAYVRITFGTGPGFEPCQRHPAAAAIKEVSFRAADARAAAKVVAEIKSLRAAVAAREKERAERATLVAQEKLVRASGGRPYTLPDVWVRPQPAGGKGRRVPGSLEAHANGFRYSSPRGGETVDVMYRNIKHAFLQPAEGEMIALVHFHLHHPIMIGAKKAKDVQFYTEVMDVVQTLDAGSGRRNAYDPDEIEEEQREREMRARVNKTFANFVKRVQHEIWEKDYGDLELEFEVPFRELGFTGVPHRSAAFVVPTVNCLVELTEMPFTVITLSEVVVVNLERVGFGLRNFDMALVFKDPTRDVVRIDAIPMTSLDTIREWLQSVDIKFYESKTNLNWKQVLKSITEDPEAFREAGGWGFLDMEASDDEEGEDSEDGDEEFAPSDSGEEEEEESSDEDDDSEFDEEEEDEEEEEDDEDDEEAGKSWEELEAEAAREDRQRAKEGAFDDSDDERKGKKRRSGGGGGGGGSKKHRR